MNEVKSPKKPMMYYYAIVILVILALNFLAVPWLSQRQVKEVDYGTFMKMIEEKNSAQVKFEECNIKNNNLQKQIVELKEQNETMNQYNS